MGYSVNTVVVPSEPTVVVVLVVDPCVVVVVETVTSREIDVVVASVFSSERVIDSSTLDRDEVWEDVATAVVGEALSATLDHVEAAVAAGILGAVVKAAGGKVARGAGTSGEVGMAGGG